MSESKLLKAHCKKTSQNMCFEMKKYGNKWKAVNMIWISNEEAQIINTEIRQNTYETNTNLLPCLKCGSRKIGGCKCSKGNHACRLGMKYQYDCAYCEELVMDYQRVKGKGPYTQWAGISNIPGAIKDKYGNPDGSQYDLAEDYGFSGEKILILNYAITGQLQNVCSALRKKGFTVEEIGRFTMTPDLLRDKLKDACQLWIISTQELMLNTAHYEVIKDFFEQGHGLYVWGDNDPLNTISNFIISRLFGARMSGHYHADKVLGLQNSKGSPGIIENHLISTGIVSFYEGITIAKIKMNGGLLPLTYSSDSNVVTAFYERDGKRALVDGAFTRLWDMSWGKTAGTERYIVNAAAWLANNERFGK